MPHFLNLPAAARTPAAGWANQELQCYTSSPDNARVVPNPGRAGDGMLVIEARARKNATCLNAKSPNSTRDYSSAKLVTAGKHSFRWSGNDSDSSPIVVTARIKTPQKDKAWPAFWMLPDTPYDWCSGCGEYGARRARAGAVQRAAARAAGARGRCGDAGC
jgi:hypothetical protein